jgi:hypothetical protein
MWREVRVALRSLAKPGYYDSRRHRHLGRCGREHRCLQRCLGMSRKALRFPQPDQLVEAVDFAMAKARNELRIVWSLKTIHAQHGLERAIPARQTSVSEPSGSHQNCYQKRREVELGSM